MKFTRYVALGDAYSCGKLGTGAADLFGTYLARTRSMIPSFLAEDLSYMTSVVRRQLRSAQETPEGVIVTLTIGQDDLLRAWAENPTDRQMAQATKDLVGLYRTTVFYILKHLPNALVFGCTVPDPSDGTGDIPGLYGGTRRAYPWKHVQSFNDGVREVLFRTQQAAEVDLARIFRGHGAKALPHELFYNPKLYLEPGQRGAMAVAEAWSFLIDEVFPAVEAKAS